jgi:hypothetical protein
MKSAANLVDRLGGILTRPTGALRAAAEERHLAAAIGLILLASLRPFFSPAEGGDPIGSYVPPAPSPAGEWALGIVLTALFLLSVHLIARAYTGHGSLLGLISAYGLAAFPKLLHFPLLLWARTGAPQPAAVVSYAVSLWALVLTVLAVRESYRLRTAGAVVTVIAAAGAVLLLLTLLAIGSLLLLGLALTA